MVNGDCTQRLQAQWYAEIHAHARVPVWVSARVVVPRQHQRWEYEHPVQQRHRQVPGAADANHVEEIQHCTCPLVGAETRDIHLSLLRVDTHTREVLVDGVEGILARVPSWNDARGA